MSFSYDAVIFFSGDRAAALKTLSSLAGQKEAPGRIFLPCLSGEEDALKGTFKNAEILPLPSRDRGLVISQAVRQSGASYLLLVSDQAGQLTPDFSSGLFEHFSDDPAAEIVFSNISGAVKDKVISRAFYDALFSVCPAYGKEEIFSFGPQLFYRDIGAALFKTALLRECPIEVNALTDPARIFTAHALYRDARVHCDVDLRTEEQKKLSISALFHDAFSFAAARRLYYQSFGIGFRMHQKMRGTGYTKNPVLPVSMGKAYGRAGKKAAGTLLKHGAFYKLPALFLIVLSGRMGDALGSWYHRLPGKLNRALSGKRYF